MRLSKQLESAYKPPSPAELKKRIADKRRRAQIDTTRRYSIIGIESETVPACEVCGTKIKKCVVLRDDLSHSEIYVGSNCAAMMLKQTLGRTYSEKQIERKAEQAQRDREKGELEDKFWNQIYKSKNYEIVKRLFGQVTDARRGKALSGTYESWKARFDKRLVMLARDVKMTPQEVLSILKWRGWPVDEVVHGAKRSSYSAF